MVDDKISEEDKAKQVTDQLSAGWLQTEREKSRIIAAIKNLDIAFLIVEEQKQIIVKNPALETILGACTDGDWTIDKMAHEFGDKYDLVGNFEKSIKERKSIPAQDILYKEKTIRLFVSPILILKESLAVYGATIVIEDVTSTSAPQTSASDALALAAHELRAPLTTIKLNSELLLSMADAPKDELKQRLDSIKNETADLIQIINNFLGGNAGDLNKKLQIVKSNFSVKEVINKMLADLKNQAEAKNISFTFDDIEQDLGIVTADPVRTKEVLYNLLDNAIKFTDSGTIAIYISQKDGFVRISVKDTGRGIKPETQIGIFQNQKKEEGTPGLGLYISKLLVDEMGGKIYLEKSETGEGTTVTFTLPMPN